MTPKVVPLPELAKKTMARARRVTLFEREIKARLSLAAIAILFERARVLSEGKRSAATTARIRDVRGADVALALDPAPCGPYFGSTMITVDVAALAVLVREPCGEDAARRVAEMCKSDTRIRTRVHRLAGKEACRLAGEPLKLRASDVRVRQQGTSVYLDVDVEEA
jgi:hypothetical protein